MRQVPSSWATWSSPPQSEGATPGVIFFPAGAVKLTLGSKADVFGFELEVNAFGAIPVQVDWNDSDQVNIGTETLTVEGAAGARLFAFSSIPSGRCIGSVDITLLPGAFGFAIGRLREHKCDAGEGGAPHAPGGSTLAQVAIALPVTHEVAVPAPSAVTLFHQSQPAPVPDLALPTVVTTPASTGFHFTSPVAHADLLSEGSLKGIAGGLFS